MTDNNYKSRVSTVPAVRRFVKSILKEDKQIGNDGIVLMQEIFDNQMIKFITEVERAMEFNKKKKFSETYVKFVAQQLSLI
jgi:hypothetical protein